MGKRFILLAVFLILGGCEVPEVVDSQGHFSQSGQQDQGAEQIPPAPRASEGGVSVPLQPNSEEGGETPDESIEDKEKKASPPVVMESEQEEEILLGKMPEVYMCVKGESVLAYLLYHKSGFYDRVCELHYSYVFDSFTYAHWERNHCKEKLTIKLNENIKAGYTCYCGAAATPAGIVSITDEGYVCSGENQ